MPRFDQPGVRFDSPRLFYDAAPVPSTTSKHKMAKPKLDLKSKTDSELLGYAQAHITAMTGNANFATPDPDATAFAASVAAFETALNTSDAAQQTAKEKVALKDAERVLMEQALGQRGNYVENASGGDEAKILSAGFSVRAPAGPPTIPPVPADLGITMGDHSGEIDLHWTPSKGAKSYIIECAPYDTPRVWQQVKIATRSSYTVTGLTPGATYAFRVKAIGSAGDSDWSDEAIKMAP